MQKTALKIINPLMLLLMLGQVTTALLREKISDDLFPKVHIFPGYLLALLVVLHLIFNWSWVKAQFFPKRAKAATPATK